MPYRIRDRNQKVREVRLFRSTHKRPEGGVYYKSRYTTGGYSRNRCLAKLKSLGSAYCVTGSSIPSGAAEYNLEQTSEKKFFFGSYFFVRSWLCIQERWNPQVANIFGGAARYSRATAGSSPDDAPRILQRSIRVKFSLFRCTSAELFFSCCDSIAAAATTLAPRSSTCEQQRATSRATALAPRSSTRDAQRAPPRETAWAPPQTTCPAPQATAGRNVQVPSTYNERRRGQRPGHSDK